MSQGTTAADGLQWTNWWQLMYHRWSQISHGIFHLTSSIGPLAFTYAAGFEKNESFNCELFNCRSYQITPALRTGRRRDIVAGRRRSVREARGGIVLLSTTNGPP